MNDEDPVIRISVTPPVARRRPPALGRGLEALMGESRREEPLVASAGARGTAPATGEGLAVLPVAAIEPHPEQPRRHFDDAALDELAASIAARGVIQPVIVRELGPRNRRQQRRPLRREIPKRQPSGHHHAPRRAVVCGVLLLVLAPGRALHWPDAGR